MMLLNLSLITGKWVDKINEDKWIEMDIKHFSRNNFLIGKDCLNQRAQTDRRWDNDNKSKLFKLFNKMIEYLIGTAKERK